MAKKRQSKKKTKGSSEIKGIIFIAISIMIAISIYTDSVGYVSVLSKRIFTTLFGIWTFIVPIYFVYASISYTIKKSGPRITEGFIIGMMILLNTMIFVQTLSFAKYKDMGFIDAIVNTNSSQSYFYSGIIGFSFTYPIYKLIGSVGIYILVMAIYVICAMIIFDISFKDLFLFFKDIKVEKRTRKSVDEGTSRKITPIVDLEDSKNGKESKVNENKDSKIKILDFIKNPKEEINNKKEEIKVFEFDENQKDSNSLDSDVKEVVNKELCEKLMGNKVTAEYKYPKIELLNNNNSLKMRREDKKELLNSATKLVETLSSFGVEANVIQVTKGPSVTRYELQPNAGVKVSKIVNLSDDIALGLAASGVRIEAPIPGKAAVGIEVPNRELSPVFIKELIGDSEFINNNKNLAFALGKDIAGKCVVADLSKMPHLLIAGATGSGKSVCINTLIISILYKYSPDEVKLLMVDPKVVELNVYNGIPHLLIPVVTDPKKAAAALNWAVNEMTRRYKMFAENGVRNIETYNALYEKGDIIEKLPWIVIIVDELSDLMMVCPHDVEDYIGRLAQMARAAGMHLVIATQRPSVDVITGVIKANIPSRISFAVSSQVDSRTILDSAGAEKLLGKGDMLFSPVGESKPVRIQGAFISEEEVEKVVSFIKNSYDATYEDDIIDHINSKATNLSKEDEKDELLDEAVKIVVLAGQASTSFLQRKLRIGFNRAARIMEQLEDNNIISKKDGSKPRQVLISKDDLENLI